MRQMARPLTGPTRHGYAPGYQAQTPVRRSGTVVSFDRGYRLDQPLARRQSYAQPAAVSRTIARQRRMNVLVILAMATAAFGFLSVATAAEFARYGLAIAVSMLIGYVYLLVQIRRNEVARSYRDSWQHAA